MGVVIAYLDRAIGAQAATEAFGARDGRAPTTPRLSSRGRPAATTEPLVEGVNFFPRSFADVEAARPPQRP